MRRYEIEFYTETPDGKGMVYPMSAWTEIHGENEEDAIEKARMKFGIDNEDYVVRTINDISWAESA